MVKIYRASDVETVTKKGYDARYVADIEFQQNLDSGGFILVSIPAGEKTHLHAHKELEEVFIALTEMRMEIDSKEYALNKGDVILVEPNESHSFEAIDETSAELIAIKFPNLKSDKITMNDQ